MDVKHTFVFDSTFHFVARPDTDLAARQLVHERVVAELGDLLEPLLHHRLLRVKLTSISSNSR